MVLKLNYARILFIYLNKFNCIIICVESIEKKISFEMNIIDTVLDLRNKIVDHFGIAVDK